MAFKPSFNWNILNAFKHCLCPAAPLHFPASWFKWRVCLWRERESLHWRQTLGPRTKRNVIYRCWIGAARHCFKKGKRAHSMCTANWIQLNSANVTEWLSLWLDSDPFAVGKHWFALLNALHAHKKALFNWSPSFSSRTKVPTKCAIIEPLCLINRNAPISLSQNSREPSSASRSWKWLNMVLCSTASCRVIASVLNRLSAMIHSLSPKFSFWICRANGPANLPSRRYPSSTGFSLPINDYWLSMAY